jgi:hypothetical protein
MNLSRIGRLYPETSPMQIRAPDNKVQLFTQYIDSSTQSTLAWRWPY